MVKHPNKSSGKHIKHGLSKSRLYGIYNNMRERCLNPKNICYQNYGGRGIKICDEWLGIFGFLNFSKWVFNVGFDESLSSKEQSLERVDVNGDYCPENCCWIPLSQQYMNRTDNHYITINGETKILKEWSDLYGIPENLIISRINRLGWSEKDAVITPVRKMRNRTGSLYWENKKARCSK